MPFAYCAVSRKPKFRRCATTAVARRKHEGNSFAFLHPNFFVAAIFSAALITGYSLFLLSPRKGQRSASGMSSVSSKPVQKWAYESHWTPQEIR